jgi:hypothetical protein
MSPLAISVNISIIAARGTLFWQQLGLRRLHLPEEVGNVGDHDPDDLRR